MCSSFRMHLRPFFLPFSKMPSGRSSYCLTHFCAVATWISSCFAAAEALTLYQSSVWKTSLVLSIRRRVPICVEDGQANCLSYGADDTVSPCPTSTGKDPRRFNTTTTIVCPASNAECSSFAGPSIDMLMDPFIVGKIRWSLASFFIILITTV